MTEEFSLFKSLNKDGGAETPPVGGRQFCGDLNMRIAKDGTWFYHGSPIGRKELVRLFASVLSRDENGEFWLITPAEMGRIQVDDAPFIGVELFSKGSGADQTLSLRTNVDENVMIDGDHPLRVETDPRTGEPSPYVTIRDGLDARLARSVYYHLVSLGGEETVEGERIFGVWSSGMFFPLGEVEEAEEAPEEE